MKSLIIIGLLLISACAGVPGSCDSWAKSQFPEEVPILVHADSLSSRGLHATGFSWADGTGATKPPSITYGKGATEPGRNVNYYYPTGSTGRATPAYAYSALATTSSGEITGTNKFSVIFGLVPQEEKELSDAKAGIGGTHQTIPFKIVDYQITECSRGR